MQPVFVGRATLESTCDTREPGEYSENTADRLVFDVRISVGDEPDCRLR